MIDWSKLPDLGAVTLLACAFASVARRSQMPVSGLWLTGWLMIALHFGAFMFLPVPGFWGMLAMFVGLVALIWAGILFTWASVPFRTEPSSLAILISLMSVNAAYIAVAIFSPQRLWALTVAAALYGSLPLGIALLHARQFRHPLRWTVVSFYALLGMFLLAFQNRPDNGSDLALNAILFTIYFVCTIHFVLSYRRATAGAFITIAGFLAWAAVFVVAPCMAAFFPNYHLESEVWNLPKYVVATGMILLLLENQIEHNKFLALHDALTGLPNRRLFQDRLARAIERARRTKARTALLLVDLDHFKEVNDALGHHAGDLLLQHVSSLFVGRVRRSDTVARTGGDEFCIILEEPTCRADAEHVADSLLQMLKAPFELEGHGVSIGASVGIALFPEDAEDMESLSIKADLEMYAVKHGANGAELAAGPGIGESLPMVAQKGQNRSPSLFPLAAYPERLVSTTRNLNN